MCSQYCFNPCCEGVSWACRDSPYLFFKVKKNSSVFCFKNLLSDFSDLDPLTARLIWQVMMVVFELHHCCFCCAFCCASALNIFSWVWGKFSSCFVRFCIFSWQITVANFLVHFFVAKLLVLVFSFERVPRCFFQRVCFAQTD